MPSETARVAKILGFIEAAKGKKIADRVWEKFSEKPAQTQTQLIGKMSMGKRNLFAGKQAQTRKRHLVRACLLVRAATEDGITRNQVSTYRSQYKQKTTTVLASTLDQLISGLAPPVPPRRAAAPARRRPPPPPPRALPKGEVSNVVVHGTPYQFYRQDFEMECGPSCLNMICRVYNRKIPQDIARREVAEHETRLAATETKNWNRSATEDIKWLTSSLTKCGLKAHTNTHGDAGILERHLFKTNHNQFKHNQPGILRIQWDDYIDPQSGELMPGGGHFVVCLGMHGGNADTVDILDPYSDRGHVTLSHRAFPRYEPHYGGKGVIDANWYVSTVK